MLFNSLEFLLVFLPLVFAGFLLLLRLGRNPVLWLTVSSLVFYAWWEPRYLVLILGSASVNYSLARWLATLPQGVWRRRLFALAIVLNLLLLGYYKYTAMLLETVALLFDMPLAAPHIVLPLLFGVRLPVNFESPYKATTVAEYLRRWHMTLSTFLRDYVYIPLGGNRVGNFSKLGIRSINGLSRVTGCPENGRGI